MSWEIAVVFVPSIIAVVFAYLSMNIKGDEYRPLQLFFFFISLYSIIIATEVMFFIAEAHTLTEISSIAITFYRIIGHYVLYFVLAVVFILFLQSLISGIIEKRKR